MYLRPIASGGLLLAFGLGATTPTMTVAQTAQAQRAEPWTGDGTVPREWLKEKISVEKAERDYTPKPDDRRDPQLKQPFGFKNAAWQTFKGNMLQGDEIWSFSSPPDSWRDLHGRAGVALVRNGIVVASIVTMLN